MASDGIKRVPKQKEQELDFLVIDWNEEMVQQMMNEGTRTWESRYLVRDLIPRGGVGTIFADAETGKSLFLLENIISLLTGTAVMGNILTGPCEKVLWVDSDMGQEGFEQRLRTMVDGRNIDNAALRNLSSAHPTNLHLDTEMGARAFKKLVRSCQPDLIVLDAFSDFLSESPSKQEPVTEALGAIKDAANNHVDKPCTVMIIGHTRKSDGSYYGSEKNISGVDFAWLAEKETTGNADHNRVSVKQIKDRHGELMQGLVFEIRGGEELDDGTMDPLRCEFVRYKQDTFSEVQRSRVLSAMHYAIEQEDENNDITVAGYVEDTGEQYSHMTLRRTWQRALDAGFLRHTNTIEYGTHVFAITDLGRNWYQREAREVRGGEGDLEVQETEEGTLEVQVNDPMGPVIRDNDGIPRQREQRPIPESQRPPWISREEAIEHADLCANCNRPGHTADRCHRLPRREPESRPPIEVMEELARLREREEV